jgi:hypothetical protein
VSDAENMKPQPGDTVVLIEVPPGLLDDLPIEDQQAINEVVGKPVLLNEYDDAGRAELEFKDRNGDFHFNLSEPRIHQSGQPSGFLTINLARNNICCLFFSVEIPEGLRLATQLVPFEF